MGRTMTAEELERKVKIEEAMKEAGPELQILAQSYPEATGELAAWIDKWFMSCGYTALCRYLRQYKVLAEK